MSNTQLPLLPFVLDGVPPGLRQALAQEGLSAVDRTAGPPPGKFLLFDSRSGRFRGAAAGQVAIDVDALRRTAAADPFEDLLDERSAPHGYRIGGYDYREEIARIDKRQVRGRLLAELRKIIERQGGVWLKLSPYPFPYRSAFNLRCNYHTIDDGVAQALADVAGLEHATTHFLGGAECEARPDEARRLAGLDIGSLGYHRVIGDDVEANVANLRRGAAVLRRLGLNPQGYAAPHGRFGLPLLAALEVLNVPYSVALALAYDELPMFPGNSRVLQLPAHPIGVGRYPDQWLAPSAETTRPPDEAVVALHEYFRELISARYQMGEPLLLFRQATPRLTGQRAAVQALQAATARCGALWQVSLTELAEWWRARAAVQLRVTAEEGILKVAAVGRSARFRVGAEFWRGDHVALLPLDEAATSFSPGALAFQGRRAAPLPHPQRVDGAQSPRRMGRRWLHSTTHDDSGVKAFRDWMSRTLRRDRD